MHGSACHSCLGSRGVQSCQFLRVVVIPKMKSGSKGSSSNTKSAAPSALAKVSLGSTKSALVNKLPSGPAGNTKAPPVKIPSSSSFKNSTSLKKSSSSKQLTSKEALKGKGKLDDDDPSGIYIRTGPGSAVPEKPFDGKGVIPQILLGTGGGRKEGSVRIANANVYESIGRLSPPDKKKEKEDDRPGKLREDLSSKRQQSMVGKDRGFVGRKTTAGGQELTTGADKVDKKQQRRFIRALLKEDEFGEPAFCPRLGVLTAIWILVIAILAVVFKFVLGMDEIVPHPSIGDLDNGSFFGRVNLYKIDE